MMGHARDSVLKALPKRPSYARVGAMLRPLAQTGSVTSTAYVTSKAKAQACAKAQETLLPVKWRFR